jgi:hypothetical protein
MQEFRVMRELATTAGIGNTDLQWDGHDVLHKLESESRKTLEDGSNYHLLGFRNREIQLGSGNGLML